MDSAGRVTVGTSAVAGTSDDEVVQGLHAPDGLETMMICVSRSRTARLVLDL